MNIVGISGSPSTASRSGALLNWALARLDEVASQTELVALRDLPASPLLLAQAQAEGIAQAAASVARANVLIIATPIYKAAYSGLLKAFLDLLPQDALRGKTVLPLATGGSLAHLLALDYALKPVLSALGARGILDGVFGIDSQFTRLESGAYLPDGSLMQRLDRALGPLTSEAPPARHAQLLELAA